MDEEHKELLKFHRTRFLQCVDIDRLIPLLQTSGVLTNDDVTDLRKYNSSEAKAEKLLDLLPSKGSQAFQAFCLALENTYPHLLTVMFLSGNKKMSGMNDDILRNSPSSAPQSLCTHQDVDLSQSILKSDLHVVNSDRDGWRRSHSKSDRDNAYRRLTTSGDSMISSLSTLSKNHGVSTSDHSLNSNREYETVHQTNDSHHRYATNDFLHKPESSLIDSDFYHVKQKSAILKLDDQRHETIILKKQYNELLADKHRLEQEIERLKRFREEDRKEVNELQRQQEMLTENGGEAAHQLYLSVVRKCEALKEEYDNLHKRYADLMTSHNTTVSKLEVTQEELSCWRKRYEDLAHERNAALHERNGLQQQCTAAIRQWDNALRERNEAREQLAKVQQQRDEAMKEINQAMAIRIKATKDIARLTEERNAAVQEYSLIMSERDTVHKEMERMQEELNEAQKVIKSSEGTNKATAEEVETLRREIASALQDRDRALKECNDLREKYGDYVTGRDDGQRDKDWRKGDAPWEKIGRDNSRKERENQWDNSCENMIKTHGQWLDDLDQANGEVESLRRQVEKLQAELVEAQQEAEVCKRRRDWAFSERDKIVLERESIRSLCDKLRKERDRAVSDLAEALRDSDDVKRQKNEASKELKELREKIEAQLEKESRMKQLNSVGNNHSRDSAIDADMQEWDTENVEVPLKFSSEDDLGLEFGGGKGDNQPGCDNVYIRSIAKGSRAEGKLKVNDCIVKINNIDVSSMDRKNVIEAIQNCSGNVTIVVKRRRMTNSRGVSNILLNVQGGKHHGLIIENGFYISKISPGSVAAREGSIAVGDRVLSINGKSIENVKNAVDILERANSTLTLQVSKCMPCPSSPPGSVSNYPNSESRVEKKKGSSSGNHGRESASSSPDKDSVHVSPKKPSLYEHDNEKSLKANSVSMDHSVKSSETSPLSPITRRRKAASDDKTRYPSSQPTLLDRAYNKIFGEKRTSKDKKNSPNTHSPLLGHDEEDPIAELDSVIEIHSKMLSKSSKENSRKPEKNGGTWPKYKGPLIQYNEVGTVARYPSRKKSERKSLATVNKQFSLYDPAAHSASKQSPESHKNRLLDDCSDNENNSRLSVTMNSDRISVFVDCQHTHQSLNCSKKSSIPIISPSASTTQTSSSGSSYASPEISSPHKTNLSGRSNEQLTDIRPPSYNSLLDYSVVSAYPNKDVLEFYKNRNRTRPRSALFGISDSDCLSSLESNASSQCGKNLMSMERTSFNHSDGIPLSFSPPDRPISAHSGHMYPVTVPTSLTASVISPNLLRSSTPFYTLSTDQRGMTHSHHSHNHTTGNHGNAVVVSPLPPASRYSSPPGLSVYTSRSGDSLLSVSVTESMLVDGRSFHTHTDSGRYSLKDSGRHSFSPSPSPCPSHYSYSNPSPTQSIDLHYHHGSSCQTPKRVVPAHSHVHPVYRDDNYSPSVADGLLTYPKRNQRIRIPSNPSVTSKSSAGKVSSSSIEKASSVSERSSPLPNYTVEWQNSDGSHSLNDYRGRIPKPGDLRNICIEKSTEPLGIQISCGEGGGIFVSSVTPNSLAAQAGLQVGDHLLEVCGINMRSATYGLAANVLRQCTDSITMLVQYNPEKFRELVPDNEDSSDGLQSPCDTPVLSHKLNHSKSVDASNDDIGSTPSSAASTLTKKKAAHNSLTADKRSKSSKNTNSSEPRLVILKKSTSNLGISLLGGNAVGIFVHSQQEDSPAQGPNGLRTGDQILEYNGVDLRHATAEEAAYELAKPADTVKILALHNYERYQEIQDQPGDSFYIRAMFDRMSINGSLAFQKDDILYVDNTMYNGVPGLWQAWLVDEEGEKIKCGFIPSKYKAEEELMMKRSLGDLEGTDGGRRGSTAARRSFFRRKRHHRSNSRDSKELASFSDVSINSCSDSGILGEELVPLTYQRVEKRHYESLRPVIIVGPLMEAVVDQLEQDFPHVFHRCIPEKMKGSLSMMERGQQELKFVDFRRRGNHFECTTVSAIKQLCDKNCHAVLDCSLSAVERLNQCMIYPIVIFLKYKSTKQIREVKDSRYLTEKVTTKAAKEMFEHALKIESEYKQLINAVIPGSNLAYMCTQVKSCVEEEQSKALWVPSGSL